MIVALTFMMSGELDMEKVGREWTIRRTKIEMRRAEYKSYRSGKVTIGRTMVSVRKARRKALGSQRRFDYR